MPPPHIRRAALLICATWIRRGAFWRDRRDEVFDWPYGRDPGRPYRTHFTMRRACPDTESHRALTELGAVRSTHVGEWTRPYALVPAALGMRVLLHEWKEDATDIATYGRTAIAAPVGVWGPYAQWTDAQAHIARMDKRFGSIAEHASTPFAFHVHATRKVFPNVRLLSTFLLERFGPEQLRAVFMRIVEEDAERFYRIVDENGIVHGIEGVDANHLRFAGGVRFPLDDAAANVLSSIVELARVERDADVVLQRRERLVPDSHVFIVLLAIATHTNGVAHHVSGSAMWSYLFSGETAQMHRTRNDRLYRMFREMLGAPENMEFVVHSPVALAPNGFDGKTQYTVDLAAFDRAR